MSEDPDMTNDFDTANAFAGDDGDDDEDDAETELKGEVKKLILDERFWKKIESLFEILQPLFECITIFEADDSIIHKSHEILSKISGSVESLVKSSLVFDARDRRSAVKSVRDRKKELMHPIMLAAAILEPAGMGANFTAGEVMDGVGYIFDATRKAKLNEQDVMTQVTIYRAKEKFGT